MNAARASLALLLASMSGCAHRRAHGPALLYDRAAELAASGDLSESNEALRSSFASGYARPATVRTDPRFARVFGDPEARERLRGLVREFACESKITMVDSGEPGTPLALTIHVVDRETGSALGGVVVELVHTDHRGLYFTDAEEWRPRLFGAACTDARGCIEVRTIRPGHYAAEYESPDEPAHVHFNIEAPGYRPYHSEILFADDTRLTPARRAQAEGEGVPVATVRTDAGGIALAEATIRLWRAR